MGYLKLLGWNRRTEKMEYLDILGWNRRIEKNGIFGHFGMEEGN